MKGHHQIKSCAFLFRFLLLSVTVCVPLSNFVMSISFDRMGFFSLFASSGSDFFSQYEFQDVGEVGAWIGQVSDMEKFQVEEVGPTYWGFWAVHQEWSSPFSFYPCLKKIQGGRLFAFFCTCKWCVCVNEATFVMCIVCVVWKWCKWGHFQLWKFILPCQKLAVYDPHLSETNNRFKFPINNLSPFFFFIISSRSSWLQILLFS